MTMDAKDLARLARDWLTFERLRQELLNQGAPDPLLVCATSRDVEQTVIALLSPTRSADEIERSYVALMSALSGHPDVAKLRFEVGEHDQGLNRTAMQAMLKARDDIFARWHVFQNEMQRIGAMVCQIFIGGRFSGTGFLISDRHVLTAYHCVDELIVNGQQSPLGWQVLRIVFDNIIIPGQSNNTYRTEFEVAKQWLIHYSKYDPNEDTQITPLDNVTDGHLDFAIICLNEPAGEMAPKWQKSIPRSWIDIDSLATTPAVQSQMLIAHYPGGADLRLCVGLFGKHAEKNRRVRYQTPTVLGSSGAPCFTVDWKPYALHNAGYPRVPINQGVPLELIRQAIGGSGKILIKRPQSRILPPVTPIGEAILDRQALAEKIISILQGDSLETAIIISSPAQGGKTYTGELIRSMLIGRGQRVFLLDAEKFASDTPDKFAKRLVAELVGREGNDQPTVPDSRQRARWISKSLAEWTRSSIRLGLPTPDQADPQHNETLWVILDRCDVVTFSAETHDLLVALIGNEQMTDNSPLRFVLLGYSGALGSVSTKRVWRMNLDLISVAGVLPFMEHILDTLSVNENETILRSSAEAWVNAVTNLGITSIPHVIEGLDRWAKTRGAKGRN